MLTQAFNFNLNSQIEKKKALISRLDGVNPSLIGVTMGGKVFIHTPNPALLDQEEQQQTEMLNLNKNISSVSAAKFVSNFPKENLILASENTLILYNVEQNSEKFYKDIPDGISVVQFGAMTGFKDGIIIVGGNCSLQGFDEEGEEIYWNAASDTVSALCFTDIDQDQENELVVGCEDDTITVFKNEEILYEITEASIPRVLAKMNKQRFAFGLENGMVGVYCKKKKVWRAKSQMKPIGIVHAKFEKSEGFRPLIVARENGQIEVRHDGTGENLYKMSIKQEIVQLFKDDFRQDQTQQIIALTNQGVVRGYVLNQSKDGGQGPLSVTQKVELHEQIEQLQKKKENLLKKHQSLQDAINKKKPNQLQEDNQILPKDTKIAHQFQHNLSKSYVELVIQSSKNTYLKSVILFSEKLFEGESFFYSPKNITNTLIVPLSIKSNSSDKIRAKVMVGTSPHSMYFQIFEFQTQLPKLANYLQIDSFQKFDIQPAQSQITLNLNERIPRYVKWVQQSFIIDAKFIENLEAAAIDKNNSKNHLIDVSFTHIQTGQALHLLADSQKGLCVLSTDSIELAGDIIQDLSHYMNVSELDTIGSFPVEMNKFKEILKQVEDYKSSKMHITADIANSINQVKTLIVKAEDSMIMSDMSYMRKYYSDVMGQNNTLMTELNQRKSNNSTLMDGLRAMNSMINKASNLRVGASKAKITTMCRAAIKSNNFHQLIHIIENGREY